MIKHILKDGQAVNSIEGKTITDPALYQLIKTVEERLTDEVERPAKAV